MSIEEMMKEDAGCTQDRMVKETRVALELLKPAIARAGIEAKRRKRHRQERRVFLLAMSVFAVFAALAGLTALQGRYAELRAICLIFAGCAACSLLLFPILERFLPKQRQR